MKTLLLFCLLTNILGSQVQIMKTSLISYTLQYLEQKRDVYCLEIKQPTKMYIEIKTKSHRFTQAFLRLKMNKNGFWVRATFK